MLYVGSNDQSGEFVEGCVIKRGLVMEICYC